VVLVAPLRLLLLGGARLMATTVLLAPPVLHTLSTCQPARLVWLLQALPQSLLLLVLRLLLSLLLLSLLSMVVPSSRLLVMLPSKSPQLLLPTSPV
jgi:hypothetical protein